MSRERGTSGSLWCPYPTSGDCGAPSFSLCLHLRLGVSETGSLACRAQPTAPQAAGLVLIRVGVGEGPAAPPLGQVGLRSSLALPMHLGEALRPQVPAGLSFYPPICWLRVSLVGTPQHLDSDHRRTWGVI